MKKKKWPIVVAVIVVLVIIVAVFGEEKPSEPQKVGGTTTPPVSSVAPSPSATPEQTTFAVGDIVALRDINVTMTDVKESAGGDFNKPADGKVFLLCSFVIENNSSSEIAVSSLMSFEAYVDDFSTNLSLTAQISTDDEQLDGTVAAGKKMRGTIGYEVPSDWKELEVHFTPSFWSGEDITFIATH